MHDLDPDELADLIVIKPFVHHMWEKGPASHFAWLDTNLKPQRYVPRLEPLWFPDCAALRASDRIGMVFHNLREHGLGSRFPWMNKFMSGCAKAGMPAGVPVRSICRVSRGCKALTTPMRKIKEKLLRKA